MRQTPPMTLPPWQDRSALSAPVVRILQETAALGRVPGLADLTITGVRFIPLSYRFPPGSEQAWSGGVLPGVTAGIVELTTGDGLVGYGETYAGTFVPGVAAALVAHFTPHVVGRSPGEITEVWQECYTRNLYWGRFGVGVSVLSAIEMAMWDLCGRALGQPVHALLGAGAPASLPCYASGGMDASPASLAAEQAGYPARGFGGTKIRGGHDPQTDAAKTAIARAAVGPDFPLAVDAVQGSNPRPWTAAEAIAAGERLAEFDLLWLEEPCAADDIAGHRACRDALPMPIAGGETLTTTGPLCAFLMAGALDVVQPDAAFTGGLLETLAVARLATHFGVSTALHVWGSGICLMGNAHVAFAADAAWLEYPTIPNPLVTLLRTDPCEPVAGRFPRPDGPGLGVHLPDAVAADFAYAPGNQYAFADRH